jgi:hypothetical protein
MFYTLTLDVNGAGLGSNAYGEQPKVLAADEVACTNEQAQNPQAWKLVNGTLVQQLDYYRGVQAATMSLACQAAIESGFTSSALGSANSYGCKAADQANINLAAIGGASLWCANSAGVWSFTAHSAAQAQQVQKDMQAHIQAEQSHYATQLAAINAATTVAAIQAVVW